MLSLGSVSDVGGLAASSAMLSPVVQTVLGMGFEASLVESLVQTKYLLTGQHYISVSELVTDVLQAEDDDRQRGPQSRGLVLHFPKQYPRGQNHKHFSCWISAGSFHKCPLMLIDCFYSACLKSDLCKSDELVRDRKSVV